MNTRVIFTLLAAGIVAGAAAAAAGKREVPGEKISSNGLDALKGLNRTLVDGLVKGEILKEAVMEEILEEIVAEKILEEMAEVKILEEIIKENILKKKVEESGEGKDTPGAKERSE